MKRTTRKPKHFRPANRGRTWRRKARAKDDKPRTGMPSISVSLPPERG